jgi:ABC-type lipoprotein release transport system permease subunit
MIILFKIAFRSILKNTKRSALIGLTLALSCTLLLFSFAIGNGIERQIVDKYRNFQSGDVSVVWSNVKEYDVNDPSRLLFSDFDIKKDKENKSALKRLDEFMLQNGSEAERFFKTVRVNGTLDTGSYASFSTILGPSEEELKYLEDKKVFELVEGDSPYGHKYGICISDDVSTKYNILPGDWVTLDCKTEHGFVNTLEYQVVGLYKSTSDYDSIYVYMTRSDALELLDQEPEYFQGARIFLKDKDNAASFSKRLNDYLTSGNDVLRAEPMEVSAGFYTMIAGFLKTLFTVFVVFLMFIIAVGIRSVVRMNLFERMKEFGTLRAIGFNRFQNFLVIFLEVLILSFVFFCMAFIINLGLVKAFSGPGIFVGKGAIAYALGGVSIHPVFVMSDTIPAMAVIVSFSLFAPLKPGLKLCFQRITDLLSQNQKPVSAIAVFFRGLVRKNGKNNRTKNNSGRVII